MNMHMEIQNLIEQIAQVVDQPDSACGVIGDVLEGKSVSRLPYIVRYRRGPVAPGTRFDLKEQFYDPEKMLYGHLEEVLHASKATHGVPLTIRPNFGTIFVPAAFGVGYEVFEEVYPWATEHFAPEDIPRLAEVDLINSEIVKRGLEYIRYFVSVLPDWIHVYLPDMQGPFDIAHLLLGDELFYLLVDDPDQAHELMGIATEGYCCITRALKEALGEPMDQMYHGHAVARGIYMRNGGVRISEDTPTLLSPDMIDEFVLPYDEKAFAEFGGGFVHFCGKCEYLLEKFAGMKGCRAVNLGQPEMYDFEWVMDTMHKNNCVYFGHWPKYEGEDVQAYISRMKKASAGGTRNLLLHFNENLFPEMCESEIYDIWNC